MNVHAFKGADGRYAILREEDHALLPGELGPWSKLGELEIRPEDPDRLGVPTAQTLENLSAYGCHFFQLTMTFEPQ